MPKSMDVGWVLQWAVVWSFLHWWWKVSKGGMDTQSPDLSPLLFLASFCKPLGNHAWRPPLIPKTQIKPHCRKSSKKIGGNKDTITKAGQNHAERNHFKISLKKQERGKHSVFLWASSKTALLQKAERHPITPLQQSEGSQTDSHFLNQEKSLKIRFVEKGTELGYGRDLKEPFQLRFAPSEFRFCKNKLLQNCTAGFALRHLRK